MKPPGGISSDRSLPHRAVPAAALMIAAILVVSTLPLPVSRAETTPDDIEWSEMARLAPESLLLDAAEADGRIFVVGDRGHILVSEDSGATWVQARVPTRSMLNAVTALDGKRAWAVGHDSVIVHTSDGGKTWERQYWAPEDASPLFDVWFENANHGLAVGAYAYFLETNDGGKTWERRDVDEEERHWYKLVEAPDGTLFVAAEFGTVFRSKDKGATWEALDTPYGGTYFGAATLKDGTLMIFGMSGKIFRSVDEGQSWEPITVDRTTGLQAGLQLTDGTVIIVGLGGTILVSKDDGKSFRMANRPDRLGIASVIEVGPNGLLLVGEGGIHWMDVP
ncbi:MAG: WD40/YVTN/BNR-like repeat-containing protein [Thermodesulfobacteriota bacterium]